MEFAIRGTGRKLVTQIGCSCCAMVLRKRGISRADFMPLSLSLVHLLRKRMPCLFADRIRHSECSENRGIPKKSTEIPDRQRKQPDPWVGEVIRTTTRSHGSDNKFSPVRNDLLDFFPYTSRLVARAARIVSYRMVSPAVLLPFADMIVELLLLLLLPLLFLTNRPSCGFVSFRSSAF